VKHRRRSSDIAHRDQEHFDEVLHVGSSLPAKCTEYFV
jgi:hypothetical protein